MFKSMITVTVFLQFLLHAECWCGKSAGSFPDLVYFGDDCSIDNDRGTCVPLRQCKHIFDEVIRAGSPMPIHMRRKLQKLACGFESKDPMVCCSSSKGTDSQKPSTHNVITDPRDKVEPITKATLEDKRGEPISVENHPNLGLLPQYCGNIDSDRINGGNRTALFEMPWMVLLSYDSSRGTALSCGGTLINEWYVLTAAHCVLFLGSKMRLDGVILGEHDIRQDPDCEITENTEYCAPRIQNVSIASVIAHDGYSLQTLVDDIALIRLAEPANFSLPSMKPLCLPITKQLQRESLVGSNGNVAGWGVTEDGLQSPVLLSVELPVISNEDCTVAYRGTPVLKDTQLCAGGVKGKDSCGGDSGGPLMYPGVYGKYGVRYVQRGIVSYGSRKCGLGNLPGVYTNVAYYMKWILDNMHS